MADIPTCVDCGLPYGDDGSGPLCIGCIAARLRAKEIRDVPVNLFAGCFDLPACLHCAAKDREIADLRERVERAERWIGRIAYDDGLALSMKQRRDGHRILRGEN